jgi:hypothetical protein
MIYYEFYKPQPKHTREGRFYLREDPWKDLKIHRNTLDLQKDLREKPDKAIGSSGMQGGGGAGIPARYSLERARKGEGRGLGVMHNRSATGVGVRRRRKGAPWLG